MTPRHFKTIPRLAVACFGHLFLFAWWSDLGKWQSQTGEAWDFFRIGSVSAVILVFTVSVFLRGTAAEKIAAVGLSFLPGFCLIGTFGVYVHEFL